MKKIFALVLAFAVISSSVVVNASSWSSTRMEKAVDIGFVPEELQYSPKDTITRKEFCTLAMHFYEVCTGIAGATSMSSSPYHDENSPAVVAAGELGIMPGVSDTRFMPDEPVMREQMAIYVTNTINACVPFDLDSVKESYQNYDDWKDISDEAIQSVSFMYNENVMRGYDGKFYPQDFVTVEQAISAFLSAYDNLKQDSITVNGSTIKINQSENELLSSFGEPDRIDKSEYGFDRYIYNSDIENLTMVGVDDGKIVEIYTVSDNFRCGEYSSDSTYSDFVGKQSDDDNNTVTIKNFYGTTIFYFDEFNDDRAYGVYQLASGYYKTLKGDYLSSLRDELFDIISSRRETNGLTPLEINKVASSLALKHCEDMRDGGYIGYEDSNGNNLFDRYNINAISFNYANESISTEYNDVFSIFHDLYSYAGTRTNILSSEVYYCGIGAASNSPSIYVTIDMYK